MAQTEQDSLITSTYFGFDFWGTSKSMWLSVYMQMANDSLPFDLVGSDAINWQKVEPLPPVQGVHSYNWGMVDTLVYYTYLAGKQLDLGVRPLSNWGTELIADSVPLSEWAMVMSPIKADSLCYADTAAWGMTARQAWKDFIYNLVERYDGDGYLDAPPINNTNIEYNVIKTLTIGNEVEAPGHFFGSDQWNPGGTIAKYKDILDLSYDTAKQANPDILIARGKSNPGHIFDDQPSEEEVYLGRQDFFDSLIADFSMNTQNYDIYAINYNDHYTSLSGYASWIKQNMSNAGISKPIMVGDARTTLFPRDNFFTENKIMPSIYTASDTLLTNPDSPHYPELKKQWQKDKVQQSIKKMVMAAANNQFQISLQPVFVDAEFQQGPTRTYMWMYSGFFDPYIYENTASLALSREPLYWSAKQFANCVIGSQKQAFDLQLGEHIYAYQYQNPNNANPIIIWYENHFLIDENNGLLKRNQDTTIDMSSVFSTSYVQIKHFITQVDAYGMPIYSTDSIVSSHSVPINEFPIILLSANSSSVSPIGLTNRFFDVFPNPSNGIINIRTDYIGHFTAQLFNLNGHMVKQYQLNNSGELIQIKIENIPNGIYFLQIISEEGNQINKVIKI